MDHIEFGITTQVPSRLVDNDPGDPTHFGVNSEDLRIRDGIIPEHIEVMDSEGVWERFSIRPGQDDTGWFVDYQTRLGQRWLTVFF